MGIELEIMQAENKASEELQNRAPENDATTMTIEFLRARLLSERAASKDAREQANRIAEQVKELQVRLEMEVESRKKTESSIEHILTVLRLKGIIKDVDALSVKSGETSEEDNTERGVSVVAKVNEILSRLDKKNKGGNKSNKDEPILSQDIRKNIIEPKAKDSEIVKESTFEPNVNNKDVVKSNKIDKSSCDETAEKHVTDVKLLMDAKESHRQAFPQDHPHSTTKEESLVNETVKHIQKNVGIVNSKESHREALPQDQPHSTTKEESLVNQIVKHIQENVVIVNGTNEMVAKSSDASGSVLEKQESSDSRPRLAFELKNIIHQIEGDLDTIDNEQSLKDRVQDWVNHVVTMLDKDKAPAVNECMDTDNPKSDSNVEPNPSSEKEKETRYSESKLSTSVGSPVNHVVDGSSKQDLNPTVKPQLVNEQSWSERDLNKDLLGSVEVKFRNEQPTDFCGPFIPQDSNSPPLMHRRQGSFDSITARNLGVQDEFGMPFYPTVNNSIPGYHHSFVNRHVSSMTDTSYNDFDYRNLAEQSRMPHHKYGNRSIFSGRSLSMDRRGIPGTDQGLYTNGRYISEDRDLGNNLCAPRIKKEAYSLADEINGRLADTLKVLHMAQRQINDAQCPYNEDPRHTSHGIVHQGYYMDEMHLAGYGYHHHQEVYVSKQPPVSPYRSSSYVDCNSLAFERHARHRRSSSLYSNFMIPGVEARFQQSEVHLCNDITLYTE